MDPTAAKAVAAFEAFLFCSKLDVDRILFMGDTKLVVEAVLANKPDWSTKGHNIDAIREQTRSFHHWRILHVSREANQIAHVLARMGLTQGIGNE